MPILNKSPENIESSLLLQLITEYDRYIQNASKEERYKNEWKPMGIDDFYDTEFQLSLKEKLEKQVEKNKQQINTVPASNWSTFSKHEIIASKQKPWWLRWLPW